jgi:disulfide bond formation protein DsbB
MSGNDLGTIFAVVFVALMLAAFWRQVLAFVFALALIGSCLGLYHMVSVLHG